MNEIKSLWAVSTSSLDQPRYRLKVSQSAELIRQYNDIKMKLQRLLGRIAATVLLIGLLTLGGGVAYNALSIRHYRAVAGVPGKLYDIGGSLMHLYCTGAGSPTIVLSSGLGDDFTAWAKVQPAIARQTRICSYDRAGFGWSEPRPGIQDADAVSSQLHQLIDIAGVERPFVLVGHSISGIYLRSYADHYLGDLAGLVFVDGSTPLQNDRVPRELVKIQQIQRHEMPWRKLLTTLGWFRVRGACTSSSPELEPYSIWIRANSCIPSQIDAIENELDAEPASGKETIHAGPFGILPILILSRDPEVLPPNWPAPVAKANSIVWNQMQEEAKSLSKESKRIIARGSDHYIQIDRSDLVNEELASFLAMLRNGESFQADHSTSEK